MNNGHQRLEGRIAILLLAIVIIFSLMYRTLNCTDLIAICVDIVLIAFSIGFGVSSIRHSSGTDRICGFMSVILGIFMIFVPFIVLTFAKAIE